MGQAEVEASQRIAARSQKTPADKMQKTPSARRAFSNLSIDRTDKGTRSMGPRSGYGGIRRFVIP
jgi:hypothetical protein